MFMLRWVEQLDKKFTLYFQGEKDDYHFVHEYLWERDKNEKYKLILSRQPRSESGTIEEKRGKKNEIIKGHCTAIVAVKGYTACFPTLAKSSTEIILNCSDFWHLIYLKLHFKRTRITLQRSWRGLGFIVNDDSW